jgi:hypothetical protein
MANSIFDDMGVRIDAGKTTGFSGFMGYARHSHHDIATTAPKVSQVKAAMLFKDSSEALQANGVATQPLVDGVELPEGLGYHRTGYFQIVHDLLFCRPHFKHGCTL